MLLSPLDRRVLKTLSRGASRRSQPGVRIAVVGNCYNLSLAYAMKLLNVNATVERFPISGNPRITGNLLLRALRKYDHVFVQDFPDGLVRGASSVSLLHHLNHAIRTPTIMFGAYHPDSIIILDGSRKGAFISGALGQHHSGIALFGYLAGLSVDAALRLYEAQVFEKLGYFDLWGWNSSHLIETIRMNYSLDLQPDLIRWSRSGCFMFTVNHPKPRVFHDLARRLLDLAGVSWNPVDFDNYALDDLARDVIFPIYPAIAEHFGIPGSYVFKAAEYFPAGIRIGAFLNLPEFVRASYRVYARHSSADLTNNRVQEWLENAEISAFLKEFALGRTSPSGSSLRREVRREWDVDAV
jgi:Polysaccharide biosynthesis enzyme WcbI